MSKFSDHNFANEKVLIRVDFNVPLDKQTQVITDDTRMRAAVPTIKKILADGGSVILMSHLGRPKEGPEAKYSLKHIVAHLSELLDGVTVEFADDCIGAQATDKAAALEAQSFATLLNQQVVSFRIPDTYTWNVKAVKGNLESDWSESSSFTV